MVERGRGEALARGALAALPLEADLPSVELPLEDEDLRLGDERPVLLAFSAAPDARWLALRLAVLVEPLALLEEERARDALLLAPLLEEEEEEDEPVEGSAPPSTFCAASATASAISAPSLPTLVAIALAALPALSAASRPASRILRRTDGLALMAAAAAARPAASISLLIAAFASLSNVSFIELSVPRPLALDWLLPCP